MIGGAVSEGAQGAAANPLNYLEGFAQGTRQLYGLAAQSQDPASPLFKFKDLVAGTGTPESRYQQFLEARDFANTTARLERGEEGLVVPPEYTNPEYVQGVSMILDPTLFVPGVGEILGAGKLATRAVGKGTQLAGRAVAGAARPLERFAGAAERMTAEAIGMTPEALRTAASTAGVAGALGIAPEAAAFAAIPAGIRTAREAGEALAMAGENLMTQPSRIGPLEAIGAAPGANLRQRMLGVVGQYGGDAALDASLRGLAGGIEGGVIGTGLGYLSGGEEGAAAGLGAGGVQGAAGAIGGRAYQKLTGKAAAEARAGDLGRFIDAQQDPTTKALFERVRDQHGVDTASALMDVEGLVKGRFGDVDVKYLSDTDFVDQYKGRARGVQVEIGDRPTIVINADILGKGKGDSSLYTLGHELFHALEKSEQLAGGATEIKNALVGRWIQEGDTIRKLAEGAFNDAEIEARFNEYRDKLSAGSPQRAAELAQFDTINKKADYIASELAAEHFAALIAGQKPDAMLKGFSGLTRQLLDAALTQNASKAIANAAASIERTFGVKPTDSVLFPDLKQASPQVNAMLRDLVRARRKLDEKIMLDDSRGGRVLKPEDISNPLAAKELVDLGLAERMPDGSIRNLSSEEIRARDDRDVTSLRSIVEKVPGARLVDGEVLGRYSPEQLSAIEQSQTISSRMKDLIRGTNLAIENGNSLFVTYFAALRRVRNKLTKKYSPKYDSGIRVSEREFSPYSFKITKADNPVVNAIDITKVRNELSKLLKKDGSIGGLWNNTDGFMTDLARYFTNLDQREGARRSAEIFGVEKAKFLGDFVGAAEKGGSKFVRSFRLDRVGSMSPMDFKAKFSEEAYQLSKQRWMPAETIGDKSIINSDEGYRIISGAKHKLYGPDGKLIGIYDTQTQAERKADATQARLQPEVDQQQRLPRNEVRQTAEAGRGDSALGRTQGREEGRQELGTVRQAGDVRFMPSSLTARDINAIADEVGGGDVKGGAKAFGAFMRSMRDKGITLRDVVKSYGITLSSIQRQELPVSTIKKNWPDAPFTEGTKVRPEDAFAQLLGTPEGQQYLNAAERGVFDEQAADAVVQKFRSFGFHNKLKEQMKTAVEQFYPKAQEIIDAVNSMPTDQFIDYVRNNFKGISYGKVGFWSGQLGRGDIPTFDSRQGKLVYGKEVPVTKQVLMDQKDRLTQLGIKVPAAFKDFAQTLLHHEVWDRLNQSDTEHGPIKEAMLRFMPSDTDYLSAVQQGDTAAAQRMVDEAAKAAGYTIGPVYHGTPTGGFNVFDKRMRGETSGVSRQAFSFTTDKKAAESYSKRLGDEAVRLDAGLRVANDAMRIFDEDVAAQEYFTSKGYSSVDDGMLPEFDWGSIDDVPEFIKELRGYAKDLKPINKRLSDSFIEAAKVMTSTKAVPEVKRVFLRIPEGAPVFQATPQTLGQVMSGFSAENQPTKAGIVELPGNERIYYVADSSQVKLVDAITKDDAGNVIPLSQRFKATSEDIRYMPSPDSAMPGAYSFPGGYRAIPGKARGSLRLYGPAGSLIGIAASLDEAQRIIRKKSKQ